MIWEQSLNFCLLVSMNISGEILLPKKKKKRLDDVRLFIYLLDLNLRILSFTLEY